MEYKVFPDREIPSEWHVEAINSDTGDIFSAVFGNADAERCAREYAAWRESPDAERIANLEHIIGLLRTQVKVQEDVIKVENGARVEAEKSLALFQSNNPQLGDLSFREQLRSQLIIGTLKNNELLQLRAQEAEQKVSAMRSALELARPVLDEELQTLCTSFCPPCEKGEVYDYSTLKEDERGWIERTEAALDAVEAALGSAPGTGKEAGE